MPRKKTPDTLDIALQGESPVIDDPKTVVKKNVKPSKKKSRKKTPTVKKKKTAPPVKASKKKVKKKTPVKKPTIIPPQKQASQKTKKVSMPQREELISAIQETILEFMPIAQDFVRFTVKEAVEEALKVVSDKNEEITALKKRLEEFEVRQEQAEAGIETRIQMSEDNIDAHSSRISSESEIGKDRTTVSGTGDKEPGDLGIIEVSVSQNEVEIPKESAETIDEIPDEASNINLEISNQQKISTSCNDAFKEAVLKTIIKMHDIDRLPFIKIAFNLEKGGVRNFTGKGKWDEITVRDLYWNGL